MFLIIMFCTFSTLCQATGIVNILFILFISFCTMVGVCYIDQIHQESLMMAKGENVQKKIINDSPVIKHHARVTKIPITKGHADPL